MNIDNEETKNQPQNQDQPKTPSNTKGNTKELEIFREGNISKLNNCFIQFRKSDRIFHNEC